MVSITNLDARFGVREMYSGTSITPCANTMHVDALFQPVSESSLTVYPVFPTCTALSPPPDGLMIPQRQHCPTRPVLCFRQQWVVEYVKPADVYVTTFVTSQRVQEHMKTGRLPDWMGLYSSDADLDVVERWASGCCGTDPAKVDASFAFQDTTALAMSAVYDVPMFAEEYEVDIKDADDVWHKVPVRVFDGTLCFQGDYSLRKYTVDELTRGCFIPQKLFA
jgi:hypothetical protein